MEGFDMFDELKEDLGDIFARSEDEYSPEDIELDPDSVVDLSLNSKKSKKDGEDLNNKNNNTTNGNDIDKKESPPESSEDKDREVSHDKKGDSSIDSEKSLKSENKKNEDVLNSKENLDNENKDKNKNKDNKDNISNKNNNSNNNKDNNKNNNNNNNRNNNSNKHNNKNNNDDNNKKKNKKKRNSKNNNNNNNQNKDNKKEDRNNNSSNQKDNQSNKNENSNKIDKSNNNKNNNKSKNDNLEKVNVNNSKEDIKDKPKEDKLSSDLNKQDAKDILNMVIDKEEDNKKNNTMNIDKNKPLYSQVKKEDHNSDKDLNKKDNIDNKKKLDKKEDIKKDVKESEKTPKDTKLDNKEDDNNIIEEKCEDCSDYITMYGKKYQEVSEDKFVDIDTGESFNRMEILETEEEKERKRKKIERDKLRDELSLNKKKNKRVKLNSKKADVKKEEIHDKSKDNVKSTPGIKSSKDIRDLINAQDNEKAIKKTTPGKREDDIFVEEALKEREGRSAPPIKNSFLAAIFMVIEELFENLRFYKISSATMYKKVLEDDLSTADLLAHVITSLFLASGLVNILSEFKIFGRANGVVNTAIARKFKFFFALVIFSPLLKLILMALLGSIFNVKRGSDREKYGDTLKYIIINSYSRFIFVFVFNIMSVFNPSIATALMVPVILKGGLKDTFNVSGLFNKRDISDVEMVIFISLYYIIMFGVLRYFYLF